MKVESYKCDNCGKLRANDANRWFIINLFPKRNEDPRATVKAGQQLQLDTFEWKTNRPGEIHLCGEDCVQRKISEFLTGKL
jgi:hypothetical protein